MVSESQVYIHKLETIYTILQRDRYNLQSKLILYYSTIHHSLKMTSYLYILFSDYKVASSPMLYNILYTIYLC